MLRHLIRVCVICHVTVDNIISYMNQDLFYFVKGTKPLKGVLEEIMPSYKTPYKIVIRHIRIAFYTHCARVSEFRQNNPIFVWYLYLSFLRTGSSAHGLG